MLPLGLAPLPISRADGEAPAPESAGWDDFVAPEVVCDVLSGACSGRVGGNLADLELSSCEDDFAGMAMVAITRVAVPVPFETELEVAAAPRVVAPVWPEPAPQPLVRTPHVSLAQRLSASRATPPVVPSWEGEEAGVAARSGYRWWLPGLVGLAATFVISSVLFVVSQQGNKAAEIKPAAPAAVIERKVETPLEANVPADAPAIATTGFVNP